jgi:hypothetical protein
MSGVYCNLEVSSQRDLKTKGDDRVGTFLQNRKTELWVYFNIGQFVICHNCDADEVIILKRNARRFYKLHGAMHRHPSARYVVVA